MDIYELHRSTSIRLRKRKEQAKKNFLQDRSTEECVYDDARHDERTYMSIQDHSMKPRKRETYSDNSLMNIGPRSLGCIPSKSVSDIPSKYSQRRAGPATKSNDIVRNRERVSEDPRDKRLWRRSNIGLVRVESERKVLEDNWRYHENSQHIKKHREKDR